MNFPYFWHKICSWDFCNLKSNEEKFLSLQIELIRTSQTLYFPLRFTKNAHVMCMHQDLVHRRGGKEELLKPCLRQQQHWLANHLCRSKTANYPRSQSKNIMHIMIFVWRLRGLKAAGKRSVCHSRTWSPLDLYMKNCGRVSLSSFHAVILISSYLSKAGNKVTS